MEILDKYLPTKVSRLATIWTIPAATGGYFVADALRPLFSFWNDETFTMFQVVIFLILCVLGCLLLAISLIHHVNTRDIQVTIREFTRDDEQ